MAGNSSIEWTDATWNPVTGCTNFIGPATTRRIHYDEIGRTAGGVPQFIERTEVTSWRFAWADCAATGYYKERPPWMSVWLLIIADNTIHVILNAIALRWL